MDSDAAEVRAAASEPASPAQVAPPSLPGADGEQRLVVGSAPQFALALRREGGLLVPADDHLRLILAEANRTGRLRDLRQMVAAWEAVAEKCDLVFEEMVRLAVFRLDVERDLGSELAQTVRHGGDRSRSPRATLRDGGLPDGITKQQAAKYRALAAIPDPAFRAYVEKARADHRVPSSSGALRFAMPVTTKPRNTRPKHSDCSAVGLAPTVLDAIGRIMTPDVCVGEAGLNVKRRVSARAKNVFDELGGDVLVADCPDPATWLPALRRLRNKAQIQQVIVALPAEVWAEWFRLLQEGGWSSCFVSGFRGSDGAGRLVAHQGARASAFRVALGHVGCVL